MALPSHMDQEHWAVNQTFAYFVLFTQTCLPMGFCSARETGLLERGPSAKT